MRSALGTDRDAVRGSLERGGRRRAGVTHTERHLRARAQLVEQDAHRCAVAIEQACPRYLYLSLTWKHHAHHRVARRARPAILHLDVEPIRVHFAGANSEIGARATT